MLCGINISQQIVYKTKIKSNKFELNLNKNVKECDYTNTIHLIYLFIYLFIYSITSMSTKNIDAESS